MGCAGMKKKQFQREYVRVLVLYAMNSHAYLEVIDHVRKACNKRQWKCIQLALSQAIVVMHEQSLSLEAIKQKAKQSL
jgi:hypothetical protein